MECINTATHTKNARFLGFKVRLMILAKRFTHGMQMVVFVVGQLDFDGPRIAHVCAVNSCAIEEDSVHRGPAESQIERLQFAVLFFGFLADIL